MGQFSFIWKNKIAFWCTLILMCALLGKLTEFLPDDGRQLQRDEVRQHTHEVEEQRLQEKWRLDAEKVDLSIRIVSQYDEVLDAAILKSKQPGNLNLSLIVAPATSKEKAQSLGDSFVRIASDLIENRSAGINEIGTTEWTYTVLVSSPQGKQLALGAKSSIGRRIIW